MLHVVVFTVFWDGDEVVGDEILGSRDCFLLGRLVFDIWMSMTYFINIIIKSLKHLLPQLLQIMEECDRLMICSWGL